MKKNILFALIAAAAIAPVAAQAADTYVGADVGRGNQKLTVEGVGSLKDNATAFKVYGGYEFNANFGIEAGYADLGKSSVGGNGMTITANPHSLYLAATGTMPLAERFALTGKIGVAKTRTDVTATGASDDHTNQTSLMFGVGTSYAVTPTVMAVVEYENFGKVIDQDGVNLKANTLSVGVRFKF